MKRATLFPLAAAVVTILLAACGSGSAGSSAARETTDHSGMATGTATPAKVSPLRAGEEFVNVTVPQPYTPSPPSGGTDEYRCLVVDPQVKSPKFLTGAQFEPKNVQIVHHAIAFLVSPQDAAKARAKDASTPGQGWTCFGNDQLGANTPLTWADTWTPGVAETLLDVDAGYPMGVGSLIVLQVHYNLLASDGRPGETDQSSLRLRLTSGTEATKPLDTVPLMAPIELPCTADESGPLCDRDTAVADVTRRFGAEVGGAEAQLLEGCTKGRIVPGNTQTCDIKMTYPITAYAARGHMHLLGRAIKVELNPGTAKARTLLDVPAFNFDDQALHRFPAPVNVKAGDILRVTCTHDASLRRMLPQLKKLPPRYVVYGDGTSDEMCLGMLTATSAT